MPEEGVVNALTRINRALVPGGVLLDLHPAAPDAYVACGGVALGNLDDGEFLETVRATEARLEEAIGLGLFSLERELRLVVADRFDSAEELLERAFARRGSRVPPALPPRVRASAAPFELRHHVVLRRARAGQAA